MEASQYVDLNNKNLTGPISQRLSIKYLEQADHDYKDIGIVDGILFGVNHCPMINLVVSTKYFKKKVNIIFMIDPASPCFYMSVKCYANFGLFRSNT